MTEYQQNLGLIVLGATTVGFVAWGLSKSKANTTQPTNTQLNGVSYYDGPVYPASSYEFGVPNFYADNPGYQYQNVAAPTYTISNQTSGSSTPQSSSSGCGCGCGGSSGASSGAGCNTTGNKQLLTPQQQAATVTESLASSLLDSINQFTQQQAGSSFYLGNYDS